MKLEKGAEVLIKATIVRQLSDNKPEPGYEVTTERGDKMMVNVEAIFVGLKEANLVCERLRLQKLIN